MNRSRHESTSTGLNRREFISLGVGALVVSAIPFRALRRHQELFKRTIPVMGTMGEITVVHHDRATAQAAIDDAIAALRWTDQHLSRFRLDSEIGMINVRAGIDRVTVSDETADVVRSALRWAEMSDGLFDPSLARASELWNFGSRTSPPVTTETERFAGKRRFREIELSSRAGREMVGVASPEAAIDLGGIAKGYGVDRAVAALRRHGIEHALVNAGGDLYALGESPDGRPWKVGIRSPIRPAEIDRTLEISDHAIATSGDYMQYFEFDGRRYHHLLDPRTGEPVRRSGRSVTVIAEQCIDADAGATAVFAMPRSHAEQVIHDAAKGRLIMIG